MRRAAVVVAGAAAWAVGVLMGVPLLGTPPPAGIILALLVGAAAAVAMGWR